MRSIMVLPALYKTLSLINDYNGIKYVVTTIFFNSFDNYKRQSQLISYSIKVDLQVQRFILRNIYKKPSPISAFNFCKRIAFFNTSFYVNLNSRKASMICCSFDILKCGFAVPTIGLQSFKNFGRKQHKNDSVLENRTQNC